jgi:replicative superfamily II helicase
LWHLVWNKHRGNQDKTISESSGGSMIDFGSLKKPDSKTRPVDPREIFKRRPSGEGAANDLWQGQAEALEAWFKSKAEETLILLNTGAGKTIIGLLIAQSYLNQGV